MIVDSSALVAIIREEPGFEDFLHALHDSRPAMISAGNWLEASLRVDSIGPMAAARFDRLVAELGVAIIPFTPDLAAMARDANRRYGKGAKHPAKLNFGDCIAYATAMAAGGPLLFKGNDFPHTDVTPALA